MALNASDFNATCHAACTADEGCVELCVAESNPEIVVDPLSIVIAVVLIGLSGLFSGLTLGLMSLDPQGLKVMIAGGNPTERRQLAKAPDRLGLWARRQKNVDDAFAVLDVSHPKTRY